MYVDVDHSGLFSIMELTPNELYVISEAIVCYSRIQDISADSQEISRRIATAISREYDTGKTTRPVEKNSSK
jgi:hypothetical protein|nr:MAG: hypothetical protein [Bacteriophage sp.]DAY88758.1 MAG TPA: hypothetical protein [Caudoviricetes sp.]